MASPKRSKAPAELVWHLFIDESGQLNELDDEVVVAGLLIRSDVPGSSHAELRKALQNAAPDFPWPFHASHLNRPVLVALQREGQSIPHSRASESAIQILRGHKIDLLSQALEQLDSESGSIDWDDLGELDRTVRQVSSPVHRDLDDEVRNAWAIVWQLVRALPEKAAEDGNDDERLLGIACGEGHRGSAIPAAAVTGDNETDRYYSLLEGAFGRTQGLLSDAGGTHKVWLQVLRRGVWEPMLKKRVNLRQQHVQDVANRVVSLEATDANVRLHIDHVSNWGPSTHPGLVLADCIANRARPVLRKNSNLDEVEEDLSGQLCVPFRSRRTHVAAVGVAGNNPTARRWAIEQASEWESP